MKITFRSIMSDVILGLLAGLSISIGCIAFLSSGNKVTGALFFVIGLFMVCNFKFNLFTGKVCYAFENKAIYLVRLLVIWISNFVGALLVSLLANLTRLNSLIESAKTITNIKMNDTFISLFILGIFCNLMIYLAVEGYAKFENPVAKMSALILGVSVFVLCGFEHCVADMFYFTFAGNYSFEMLLRLVIITMGNCVGGIFIPGFRIIIKKLEEERK